MGLRHSVGRGVEKARRCRVLQLVLWSGGSTNAYASLHTHTHIHTHTHTHTHTYTHTYTHTHTNAHTHIHTFGTAPVMIALSLWHTQSLCHTHTKTRIDTETRAQQSARHNYCTVLQHSAPLCSMLQHTVAHCNTVQHVATHYNIPQHSSALPHSLAHVYSEVLATDTATHCNAADTLSHSRILPLKCIPAFPLPLPVNSSASPHTLLFCPA